MNVKLILCFLVFQMNYSPTEDTKSKKSWGQRLKLSPNGNSNSGQGTVRSPNGTSLYGTVSGPGGSALSKSMKYAETWLYGTVRAPSAPSRPGLYLQYAEPPSPVLISTPQPPVQNYAVMVCSCAEYLNGTKKGSSKKVSICKKCKGSRLPLGVPPVNGTVRGQIIGGTMRGPPPLMTSGGTIRGGTMKIQPTTKSRPTILSIASPTQASDPYDLMRRTRLSSPLDSTHVGSQFTAARSRAKSISPVRNRGRRRSPSANDTLKVRSKSVSRSKDLWYEDIQNYENEAINRRSILECDVNPYDLMQKTKMEKLQQRNNADDDDAFGDLDNDDTFNLKKLQQNLSKKGAKHNGPYSNVQAIGGQRIRIFGELSIPSVKEDFVYDDVEVSAQIEPKKVDIRPEQKQIETNNSTGSKVFNGNVERYTEQHNRPVKARSASPKRPPRRSRTETSEEESESDRGKEKQKIVTKQSPVNNSSAASVAYNRSPSAEQAIKSILKKPRGDRPVQNGEQLAPASPAADRAQISGSHFYLPTPQATRSSPAQNRRHQSSALQRKKVQFLVENEIVSSPESIDVVRVADTRVTEEDTRVVQTPSPRSEGSPQTPDSGSHNLVNTHNAKNNDYQKDKVAADGDDEARSQSGGSVSERLQHIEIGKRDTDDTQGQVAQTKERFSFGQSDDGRHTESSDSGELAILSPYFCTFKHEIIEVIENIVNRKFIVLKIHKIVQYIT